MTTEPKPSHEATQPDLNTRINERGWAPPSTCGPGSGMRCINLRPRRLRGVGLLYAYNAGESVGRDPEPSGLT